MDTEQVTEIAAWIAAAITLITGIISFIFGWINRHRIHELHEEVLKDEENREKDEAIAVEVLKDELIENQAKIIEELRSKK